MGASGISDRLIQFVNTFVGRFRGGLGAVTVVCCALFGAISGSGASAIAAIGSIMIPKMVEEGYPRGHSTALVGCSSVLALLIPPSIPMIVFALTGGLSVAACFLSTILPGIIIVIIYCVLNVIYLRNVTTLRTAPKIPFTDQMRDIAVSTGRAIFALLMPLIMLGGIYSGICTPTEAAAVALVYTLPVGFFIYRGLNLRAMGAAFVQGAMNSGAILIILFFLFTLSRAMVLEQVPAALANGLMSVSENKYIVLVMINILLLLVGMLVDDVSGSILAAIILMPVIQKIGVHPIHFAAIVGTNLGLGNNTPPCAPLLYMAGAVGGLPLNKYIMPAFKFMVLGHLPVVFIVTYLPDLALFLPRLLMGIK
jgi:tripartite ATP-independent transporter DctM subunit